MRKIAKRCIGGKSKSAWALRPQALEQPSPRTAHDA
jgi:hypothetical protein